MKSARQAGMPLGKKNSFENSVAHFCVSLTRRKPLTGAITKLAQ